MKRLAGTAKNLMIQAIDTVLPPRCVVTGEIVVAQGTLAPKAWAGLDFIAEPYCAACGLPFDFAMEKGTLCVECLQDLPVFETARSALKYNEASRALILGFKHADKTHAAVSFLPWLKRAGQEMLAGADCLAPVPLHPFRLIARRYNQAAIIAYALGRQTGHDVVPDLLVRTRHTPSQGYLRAAERAKNVKKAFMVNPKRTVSGKTIVLIDDVYTTGSTVKECARVLMKAGAEKIHVLTVARVVKAV